MIDKNEEITDKITRKRGKASNQNG